jgi:uncharacterized membrane protein
LLLVLSLAALTSLIVLYPALDGGVVQAILGIAFVLLAPGYALVSALFPEAGRPLTGGPRSDTNRVSNATSARFADGERTTDSIDLLERIALSFALSIGVVALLAIGLFVLSIELTQVSTLLAINAVTVVFSGIAAVRRWRLPVDQQFRVSPGRTIATAAGYVTDADTRGEAVLNVGLAVALVFAVGTLSFAVVNPSQGERFTDFYVLSEDEDGELVSANYPTEFTVGDGKPVVLGLENHEDESSEYTIVVVLQRVEVEQAGDGSRISVLEEEELDRIETQVSDEETWQERYMIEPTMKGESLRLNFLLYEGDPPADPTVENAHQELHIWISVGQ